MAMVPVPAMVTLLVVLVSLSSSSVQATHDFRNYFLNANLIRMSNLDLILSKAYNPDDHLQPQTVCGSIGFHPIDLEAYFVTTSGFEDFKKEFEQSSLLKLNFYVGTHANLTIHGKRYVALKYYTGHWHKLQSKRFATAMWAHDAQAFGRPQLCGRITNSKTEVYSPNLRVMMLRPYSKGYTYQDASARCGAVMGFSLPSRKQLFAVHFSSLRLWWRGEVPWGDQKKEYECMGCRVPVKSILGMDHVDSEGRVTCLPGYVRRLPQTATPTCSSTGFWDVTTIGSCEKSCKIPMPKGVGIKNINAAGVIECKAGYFPLRPYSPPEPLCDSGGYWNLSAVGYCNKTCKSPDPNTEIDARGKVICKNKLLPIAGVPDENLPIQCSIDGYFNLNTTGRCIDLFCGGFLFKGVKESRLHRGSIRVQPSDVVSQALFDHNLDKLVCDRGYFRNVSQYPPCGVFSRRFKWTGNECVNLKSYPSKSLQIANLAAVAGVMIIPEVAAVKCIGDRYQFCSPLKIGGCAGGPNHVDVNWHLTNLPECLSYRVVVQGKFRFAIAELGFTAKTARWECEENLGASLLSLTDYRSGSNKVTEHLGYPLKDDPLWLVDGNGATIYYNPQFQAAIPYNQNQKAIFVCSKQHNTQG